MKAILLLLMLTAAALAQPSAPIKDPRDGKTYRAVKIGEQVWMAENLQFDVVFDKDKEEWSDCYANKLENCAKYGRLYNWNAALKACPSGWHLPDSVELNVFVDFVGGIDVAGKKLKAKSGWSYNGKSGNGEDEFRFMALPGGAFMLMDEDFMGLGFYGSWWSSTKKILPRANYSYHLYISADREKADMFYKTVESMLSVRCVRD